ncbi:hypothetical protein [Psychrobacter sp. FDAARGOS_221]|uniref:hypothetical protein n=1 Tax=Psychrobacter sp. FDAARGOS_221 TaxID=1975705 RepID=UPI00187D63EB|nr:hypothetical protein [Psychrobacter sp. FDAARGOS_221]
MSNDKAHQSDVKKAAENTDPSQLNDNLKSENTDKAQNLSDDEQTPFIEDDLRTDK